MAALGITFRITPRALTGNAFVTKAQIIELRVDQFRNRKLRVDWHAKGLAIEEDSTVVRTWFRALAYVDHSESVSCSSR